MSASDGIRDIKRKVVAVALHRGYQVTEEAVSYICSQEDPINKLKEIMNKLEELKPGTLVIDSDTISDVLGKGEEVRITSETPEEPNVIELRFKVKDSYPYDVRITGSVKEFREHFLSRYTKLKRILEQRGNSFVSISNISKVKDGSEFNLAVMVYSRSDTEKSVILRCEDTSGSTTVYIPKRDMGLAKESELITPDQVIGIRVKKIQQTLIATDIYLPDVPAFARPRPSSNDAYVCLISDIHIGSKKFRKDLFESFLDWINRGRDGEVKRVRCLIIAGDLVDGIGVYPGQERDLEVRLVKDQVKIASKMISDIPDRIKIVFSPGNHEPTRKALPQPPLPEEYSSILKRHREVELIGNPADVEIGGRRFIVYHGQGLNDMVESLPGISYSNLKDTMRFVLEQLVKSRHLAPCYGENTPVLPLREDPLVVEEVPDILHTGHLHVASASKYRDIALINSGTWQEQTSYQRGMGLVPTVGTAVLVNLLTLSAKIKVFT